MLNKITGKLIICTPRQQQRKNIAIQLCEHLEVKLKAIMKLKTAII